MSGDERTVVFQLPSVVSGQLACLQGSVAGRSWRLSAGTFVIGRSEGSDLHLPNEPGVSKVHAKIVAEGDHYRLVDAESRNGTIVNGAPVQTAALKDGDEIQICGCRLRFSQTGGAGGGVRNESRDEVTAPTMAAPARTREAPPPSTASEAPATEAPVASAPADPPPLTDPERELEEVAAPTVPSPEVVEVRGSTLPAFFTGLFVILFTGGGGYAALLYANDGAVPPPESAVAGLDEEKASDPVGDEGDPVDEDLPEEGVDDEDEDRLAGEQGDLEGGQEPGVPAVEDEDEGALADAELEDEPDEAPPPDEAEAEAERRAAARAKKRAARAAARRREMRAAKRSESQAEKKRAEKADEDPKVAAADPEPAPAEEEPAKQWVPASYVKPSRAPVRAPAGGTVASIDVKAGATVKKGQTLARIESSGASRADIETKKESIRALKSIVEASGDPEAQKLLTEEEQALQAMQASSRSSTVSAPTSGTLTKLNIKKGESVRSRLVVGFIEPDAEPYLRVSAPAALGRKVRPGQTVRIRTAEGEYDGKVRGKPRKKGKSYVFSVVAPAVDLSTADAVELP